MKNSNSFYIRKKISYGASLWGKNTSKTLNFIKQYGAFKKLVCNMYYCKSNRAPVNMGTVGASDPQFLKVWVLAPMSFGKFSHTSIIFHKNCVKNVKNLAISRHNEISVWNSWQGPWIKRWLLLIQSFTHYQLKVCLTLILVIKIITFL